MTAESFFHWASVAWRWAGSWILETVHFFFVQQRLSTSGGPRVNEAAFPFRVAVNGHPSMEMEAEVCGAAQEGRGETRRATAEFVREARLSIPGSARQVVGRGRCGGVPCAGSSVIPWLHSCSGVASVVNRA